MTADDPLECIIAQSGEEREQVYRLRYAGYRRHGPIVSRADGIFADRYDDLRNCFNFLVRTRAGEAVAAVRVNVVCNREGWQEAPLQQVFGDHAMLPSMAVEGYVEASQLVFARQAERDLFVQLVGHMAALATVCQTGWLLACPRIEHGFFYQRMFGFRPMGAPRQHRGAGFRAQLLAARRDDVGHYVEEARPIGDIGRPTFDELERSLARPAAGAAFR
jgi:hypothetical protein